MLPLENFPTLTGSIEENDFPEHAEMLEQLGLTLYFPEKITLHIAMKKYSVKLDTLKDVPWYYLSKLLMLDSRVRNDCLPERVTEEAQTQSSDALFDLFTRLEVEPAQAGPHPLDVLVVLFQCSSNCLRQTLCEKMFVCKLSIPLLLPQFMNRKSMFLVWSLRNIILEYSDTTEELGSSSVVNIKAPIVSCLRLGKISRSKSKFLNEILNYQSHDTYFHKDCRNGMMQMKISKGLIELALYLPSASETKKDGFGKVVMFANLRGNGLEHSSGIDFLHKVCNVILVMVSVSDLGNQEVLFSLKAIASSQAETILMLTKEPGTELNTKLKEKLTNCIGQLEKKGLKKTNIIVDFSNNGDKNIKELRGEVINKINGSLMETSCMTTLENHKTVIEDIGITTDESMPKLGASRQMALKLITEMKRENAEINKSQQLPLQGKLWQDWALLSKEEQRLKQKNPNESLNKYVANLHSQKKEKRREQLKYLEKPNTFFETLLKTLRKLGKEDRIFYMKWLKLYLDEISRKTLPALQKEYSVKVSETTHTNKQKSSGEFKEELLKLAASISDASLGVEHLMREICQAYEAVVDLTIESIKTMNFTLENLPKIIAELMLEGYPLEVMDGDASYVPLSWITSVLTELGELIGEEKAIFVLSVLGIQSSGKSTMLNTMFGVQFSVAAGRCTRGVYVQLVPLSKEYSEAKYDYILIVDTEGLRAPELGQGHYEHDNEIATFVIGLGDVTVVNVKGENLSEIEDVLQIVVHAILKMKLVNKDLKLQPSCIFVHQNVAAVDAALKMKGGQQKLLETLDKVTLAAGIQEDAPEVTNFEDVIEFDVSKHIYYVSDLWKGDPPMAPVNPGYSTKITAIKQNLLTDIMLQRYHPFTVSKLCLRIADLWNGILSQNFVFSFRNSITLQSYSLLEAKLSHSFFSMGDKAMKWLNTYRELIWTFETNLEELEKELLEDSDEHFKRIHLEEKDIINLFFKERGEKEIFEQWRVQSELKLQNVNEENLITTKRRIREEIAIRKVQLDHEKHLHIYTEKIPGYVKSLLQKLKSDPMPTKSFTRERFDSEWNKWLKNFPMPFDNVDIYKSFLNAVLNTHIQDQPLLFQLMEEYYRKKIIRNFSECIKKNIARKDSGTKFRKYQQSSSTEQLRDRSTAEKKVNALLNMIDCKVCGRNASEALAQFLIQSVKDLIKELNSSGVTFISLDRFKICITVFTCQFATFQIFNTSKTEINMFQTVDINSEKTLAIDIHPVFKSVATGLFQT